MLFGAATQLRVKSKLSGDRMSLLAQAMDVDLSRVTVYELSDVDLLTCDGVHGALSEAERMANPGLCKTLRRHGQKPIQQVSETVDFLSLAAYGAENYPVVVDFLLSMQVRVRRLDDFTTPLHVLAQRCEAPSEEVQRMIERLLAAGIDINTRNRRGHRALFYTSLRSPAAMQDLLRGLGCDPSADDLTQFALSCEESERFPDMFAAMKLVPLYSEDLSEEQRNLFSVASKAVVGALRNQLQAVEEQDEGDGLRDDVREQIQKFATETGPIIDRIVARVEAAGGGGQEKAFFYKMMADNLRWGILETFDDPSPEQLATVRNLYETALEVPLPAVHPTRLGTLLNYTVLVCDYLHDRERACAVAKAALGEAEGMLDEVPGESRAESELLMQLIRDKLKLWETANSDNDEDAVDGVDV